MNESTQNRRWKQLQSEPALLVLPFTEGKSKPGVEGPAFYQAVCTMQGGWLPQGFPFISSPMGPLSHLSEVTDLTGCLLLIFFPSFFGVLVWVEAPIESLATGEGAAATGEAEWM